MPRRCRLFGREHATFSAHFSAVRILLQTSPMSRVERLPLPLVLAAFVSCAPYRPPFTQPTGARVETEPGHASLVFLWPVTNCDPAGYFTLATAGGHFIGNISRGSRMSVLVPAGESTVVGWNDLVEAASGSVHAETVPVLHADLREGRTYYVRMAFGEWDDKGPPEPGLRGGTRVVKGYLYGRHRCIAVPESATSAMVTVSPAREGWQDLPEWISKLDPIVPDRAAGQAWLDDNRALLASHVTVGQDRFAGLRPDAMRQATIGPADAAPR